MRAGFDSGRRRRHSPSREDRGRGGGVAAKCGGEVARRSQTPTASQADGTAAPARRATRPLYSALSAELTRSDVKRGAARDTAALFPDTAGQGALSQARRAHGGDADGRRGGSGGAAGEEAVPAADGGDGPRRGAPDGHDPVTTLSRPCHDPVTTLSRPLVGQT